MMTNTEQLSQHLLTSPAASQWQKIGVRQHHGIVIPLFSLHSADSCGIGEYLDLLPLISWCRECGFDAIQLLPLNDTGQESSPYSALSAYALNPIYLSLSQLPHALDNPMLKQQIADLQKLTQTQRIPYAEIIQGKDQFLRQYYKERLPSLSENQAYQAFKQSHAAWLTEYALFKSLKVQQKWQSWESWPPQYKDPSPTLFQHPPKEIAEEMDYHRFIQFLCFQQFEQVKYCAEKEGVFLKGDIPILINRESADVWHHRDLFFLQFSAGAPPDMYSEEGQKWGFPLYDWDAIASKGYRWWIERLAVASQLYHIYRIDHIVGFYRIWAIPLSLPAKEGQFFPDDPVQWIPHGESIMRVMLKNCAMLPIGEDLGTVPTEVRVSLRNLGICGTKVMRWERRWKADKGFINPKDYPPESMTTVSTHDSETLQQWWENRPEEAQLYAKTFNMVYNKNLNPQQRMSILHASHHSNSLFHINLLQEYLALFPDMTWSNPEDERINIPSLISDRNWSYRFRPSVEAVVAHSPLKNSISTILC